MKIVKPSYEIVAFTPSMIDVIEDAARICYLSEPKTNSFCLLKRKAEQDEFVRKIIAKGHHSVLEHGSITVDLIFNRSVSHQLVRHRVASFSQESQRYCNYSKDKFDNNVHFIESPFSESEKLQKVAIMDGGDEALANRLSVWFVAMQTAEWAYLTLLKMGAKPEEAREVLPNATKTKMRITANVREWRHIFQLRASSHADARIREVMRPLLEEFVQKWPVLFEDIEY